MAAGEVSRGDHHRHGPAESELAREVSTRQSARMTPEASVGMLEDDARERRVESKVGLLTWDHIRSRASSVASRRASRVAREEVWRGALPGRLAEVWRLTATLILQSL